MLAETITSNRPFCEALNKTLGQTRSRSFDVPLFKGSFERNQGLSRKRYKHLCASLALDPISSNHVLVTQIGNRKTLKNITLNLSKKQLLYIVPKEI